MTQPTIEELARIKDADPYVEAVLEFVWAFTDWWENTLEDEHGDMRVDSPLGAAMQQAYTRWYNLR